MADIFLTQKQAFATLQHFIDVYYTQTGADDLGGIASCLTLLDDGKPADSAFADDWLASAKIVVPGYTENQSVTKKQAYGIAKEFLELYCRIGCSPQVQELIQRMAVDEKGDIPDQGIKDLWEQSIAKALTDGPVYMELVG